MSVDTESTSKEREAHTSPIPFNDKNDNITITIPAAQQQQQNGDERIDWATKERELRQQWEADALATKNEQLEQLEKNHQSLLSTKEQELNRTKQQLDELQRTLVSNCLLYTSDAADERPRV